MRTYSEREAIGIIGGHAERIKARDRLARKMIEAPLLNNDDIERYAKLTKRINIVEKALDEVLTEDENTDSVRRWMVGNFNNTNDFPAQDCPWEKSTRTFNRRHRKLIEIVAGNFE